MDWTIPDWEGEFLSYDRGNADSYSKGVARNRARWNGAVKSGEDDNWGTFVNLQLNRDPRYLNKTNTTGEFYPKHYNVDWYIKYQ